MNNYIYYNRNPKKETLPDCVTRAISTALNLDYYEVQDMLLANGEYYSCDQLCVACYEKLLTLDLGLEQYYGNGKSVQEIAYDFQDNILLLRVDGHLTCSLYGNVYDIFNCTNEIVTHFWVVE